MKNVFGISVLICSGSVCDCRKRRRSETAATGLRARDSNTISAEGAAITWLAWGNAPGLM